MSKEILIAGSGFMGTSMAHALENCNISCFETHEAYLATLKNLNIYKNIFSDVSDIKGEFDLIIICTRQKDVLGISLIFLPNSLKALLLIFQAQKIFCKKQIYLQILFHHTLFVEVIKLDLKMLNQIYLRKKK